MSDLNPITEQPDDLIVALVQLRRDLAAARRDVAELLRIRPVPGCPHIGPGDGACAHPRSATPYCHPGADCPMLADLVGPAGHVIEFRPDGWTLQHPLACRPDLFNCPLNQVGGKLPVPSVPWGRYECELNDLGDRLLILDRVDLEVTSDGPR